MKIIISPAKKMRESTDCFDCTAPHFKVQADELACHLARLPLDHLTKLLACNDTLARQSYEQYRSRLQPNSTAQLTPALLAYDGIQYKYMSPIIFDTDMYAYVSEHLVILSALYGGLLPFDGVMPYRLEMQAKLGVGGHSNLYSYWGEQIYEQFFAGESEIIDLASSEYSRVIARYVRHSQRYVEVVFGELSGGKVVQKGVYVKMARGEMVHYLASGNITEASGMKGFNRLGFSYNAELSSEDKYVFIKQTKGE